MGRLVWGDHVGCMACEAGAGRCYRANQEVMAGGSARFLREQYSHASWGDVVPG